MRLVARGVRLRSAGRCGSAQMSWGRLRMCCRAVVKAVAQDLGLGVGAGNSAVVVDLSLCGPMLSPRVPHHVPILGPRMERETPECVQLRIRLMMVNSDSLPSRPVRSP